MKALPGTKTRRRIYLMRHGHVDYFSPQVREKGEIHSVPLTERGRSEAQAAGKALSHVPFDRALCSGYPRTRQTAEIVLSFSKSVPALEVDPDLVELRGGTLPPVKSRQELGLYRSILPLQIQKWNLH